MALFSVFYSCVVVERMMFVNKTGTIGLLLEQSINNVTGSFYGSLFLAILFLLFICILLRIPTEYSLVLITPFILLLMSFNSSFMLIGGLFLIYLAIIFTKQFFLN